MECRTEAAIAYVMFNAYWDTFIGNTIDQSDKPLPPGMDTDRHVKYLLNSLRTLQKTTSLDRFSLTLWLVELDPNGLTAESLRSRIAAVLPNVRLHVRAIGRPLIQRFILNAKKIPLEHYRSPNMLHEYVLLFVMSQAAEERLIIVDGDVLFVRKNAPDELLALLDRHPDKDRRLVRRTSRLEAVPGSPTAFQGEDAHHDPRVSYDPAEKDVQARVPDE